MFLFLLLSFSAAEVICDYDEPCTRPCSDSVCEYFWNIEHRLTGTWRTTDYGSKRNYAKGALRDFPIRWNKTRNNFDIVQEGINKGVEEVIDENGKVRDPLDELENLLLVDGQQMRKIITINGQMPGPNIIVNKGALVKIHVKSTMHEESFSLHWHGLHQVDNYWNDGAAMFSQCPVHAHNSFTYVMRAENSGTHWYHSHYGIQRADGLHGAFIILDEDEKAEEVSWMPLVLTDWWNTDSTHLAASDPYRYGNTNGKRFTGAGTKHCRTDDKPFMTGVKMSSLCVDSIVANGRGQFRVVDSDDQFSKNEFQFSVLEEHLVPKTTKKIQLKTIHAGFEQPIFIRAIGGQRLMITALDGRRVLPEEGDGIFMGVGETVNIEVDFPLEEDRLELIAEIMFEGIGKSSTPTKQPFVKISIVRDGLVKEFQVEKQLVPSYPDAVDITESAVDSENETVEKLFLNCPSEKIGDIKCKTVVDFRRDLKFESRFAHPPPSISEQPDRVIELNMNFAIGAAINGIEFKYPETPFFDGVIDTKLTKCSEAALTSDGGHCTNILEVKKGELIEFRVTAAEHPENKIKRWQRTYHAIHLHGYEFIVTDIGFGSVNETTGFIDDLHPAIHCKDDHLKCNRAHFDEKLFKELRSTRDDHIAKNTVVVPSMGYVVFRLRADNPGVWPFHCHQLFHNYEGMAVAFFVKDEEENKPFSYLPKNMPRCHDYHPKDIAIKEASVNQMTASGMSAIFTTFLLLIIFAF